ncbi:MAG: site-2 protease family protein [Methanoregula sp.]|jgi:membrane-associated protease RseP (regulator of RpoE activity)|nr:site-2 protease family protein [Methanoregula sp.]
MDWLLILVLLVAAYTAIAFVIHRNKLWEEHIVFYGPIMAIKTNRIGFFDKFAAYRTFFRLYGTAGVIAVIIISVFITVMLFISVRYTLLVQPEPTGIYKPQNILLLPGINEYVPSTLAVWLAFIITIGIHEFGHAILCRVENIKVKTMGALIAVIPIGFFVEPDEEELDKTKGMAKVRMFGAGITNNLVVGFSCFVLLVLCMGLVIPIGQPIIHGVYKDYPAANAGIPPGSFIKGISTYTTNQTVRITTTPPGDLNDTQIPDYGLNITRESERYYLGISNPSQTYNQTIDLYLHQKYFKKLYGIIPANVSINTSSQLHEAPYPPESGIPGADTFTGVRIKNLTVSTRQDISAILNTTKPGDSITLIIEKDGITKPYNLTLTQWPDGMSGMTSGFMGVEYYDGTAVMSVIQGMLSPIGFFQFLIVPFANDSGAQFLRILAFETPDTTYYQVPFEGYWGVVHLLFWCGWINLNVGIFNAIPMIPLDGGYIFKEGVERMFDRRGLMKYSGYVTSAVSYLMLVVLVSLIALPYLLHL